MVGFANQIYVLMAVYLVAVLEPALADLDANQISIHIVTEPEASPHTLA